MFEKENNVFMDIYQNVTDKKYRYIVIDNTPETASDHQIVADIFNECKRYVILDSLAPNKLSKGTQQIEEVRQPKKN